MNKATSEMTTTEIQTYYLATRGTIIENAEAFGFTPEQVQQLCHDLDAGLDPATLPYLRTNDRDWRIIAGIIEAEQMDSP